MICAKARACPWHSNWTLHAVERRSTKANFWQKAASLNSTCHCAYERLCKRLLTTGLLKIQSSSIVCRFSDEIIYVALTKTGVNSRLNNRQLTIVTRAPKFTSMIKAVDLADSRMLTQIINKGPRLIDTATLAACLKTNVTLKSSGNDIASQSLRNCVVTNNAMQKLFSSGRNRRILTD